MVLWVVDRGSGSGGGRSSGRSWSSGRSSWCATLKCPMRGPSCLLIEQSVTIQVSFQVRHYSGIVSGSLRFRVFMIDGSYCDGGHLGIFLLASDNSYSALR